MLAWQVPPRSATLAEQEGTQKHLRPDTQVLPAHVVQVPARSATLAEQEGTHKEIADLQQQSADLDALFEQRKQQFAGVSWSCGVRPLLDRGVGAGAAAERCPAGWTRCARHMPACDSKERAA